MGLPAAAASTQVDGERVQAQAGSYDGAWIARGIDGPFKGGPGTAGW